MVKTLDAQVSGIAQYYDELLIKRILSDLQNFQHASSETRKKEIRDVMQRIQESEIVRKFSNSLFTAERMSQDLTNVLTESYTLREDLEQMAQEISKFEARMPRLPDTHDHLVHYQDALIQQAELIAALTTNTKNEISNTLNWLDETVYLGPICLAVHDMVTGFTVARTEKTVLDDLKSKADWKIVQGVLTAVAELTKAAEQGEMTRESCANWPVGMIAMDPSKFTIGFDRPTVPTLNMLAQTLRGEDDKLRNFLDGDAHEHAETQLAEIARIVGNVYSYYVFRVTEMGVDDAEFDEAFVDKFWEIKHKIEVLRTRAIPIIHASDSMTTDAKVLLHKIEDLLKAFEDQLKSKNPIISIKAPRYFSERLETEIHPLVAEIDAKFQIEFDPVYAEILDSGDVPEQVAAFLLRKFDEAHEVFRKIKTRVTTFKQLIGRSKAEFPINQRMKTTNTP
jgi:hypothetical protein